MHPVQSNIFSKHISFNIWQRAAPLGRSAEGDVQVRQDRRPKGFGVSPGHSLQQRQVAHRIPRFAFVPFPAAL